jgi:hypothetical protein
VLGAPLTQAGDPPQPPPRSLSPTRLQVDSNALTRHFTRAVVTRAVGRLEGRRTAPSIVRSRHRRSIDETLYVAATHMKIDLGRPADAVAVARQASRCWRNRGDRSSCTRALAASGPPNEALPKLDLALVIAPPCLHGSSEFRFVPVSGN